MHNHPALPFPHRPLPAPAHALERGTATLGGLSFNGMILFTIGLLVVASGYTALRPSVMGLALHPYLIPLAAVFPFVAMSRIHMFPVPILVSLLIFGAMYCFSVFNGGSIQLGEIVKIVSSVVTTVTCALLVRKRGDFVAGALGLSLAVALLAVKGLQEDSSVAGIEVMEGANKNSYSMYALPAILMAGFICVRMQTVPLLVRGMLMALTLPAIVAIFLSANRSGYLGCVLVGLMLFWDKRGRGLLVVGAMALLALVWIVNFGNTSAFDRRLQQTVEGNTSDSYRIEILKSCARIALENPIIGVSPQVLPFELGRMTHVAGGRHMTVLDSHNVFAHVAAASGLICLAAMIGVGLTMAFISMGDGRRPVPKTDPLYEARKLMRMMVILWAFRGMFSREILYNPPCAIGLGLSIGLFMLAQARYNQQAASPLPVPPGPRPLPTA